MSRSLHVLVFLSLGLAAAPVAAQVVTADADARGIPTIAPLTASVDDAVVNISVVFERPTQMTPLFRDLFFQPFLPPLKQMPPQRQMVPIRILEEHRLIKRTAKPGQRQDYFRLADNPYARMLGTVAWIDPCPKRDRRYAR